jgi:hypothetical protein
VGVDPFEEPNPRHPDRSIGTDVRRDRRFIVTGYRSPVADFQLPARADRRTIVPACSESVIEPMAVSSTTLPG